MFITQNVYFEDVKVLYLTPPPPRVSKIQADGVKKSPSFGPPPPSLWIVKSHEKSLGQKPGEIRKKSLFNLPPPSVDCQKPGKVGSQTACTEMESPAKSLQLQCPAGKVVPGDVPNPLDTVQTLGSSVTVLASRKKDAPSIEDAPSNRGRAKYKCD